MPVAPVPRDVGGGSPRHGPHPRAGAQLSDDTPRPPVCADPRRQAPRQTRRSPVGCGSPQFCAGPRAPLGGAFDSPGSVWSCAQWPQAASALPTGRRESRPSDRTPTLPEPSCPVSCQHGTRNVDNSWSQRNRGQFMVSEKPGRHRRLIVAIFYRSITPSSRELTQKRDQRPAKRGQNREGTGAEGTTR